MATRLYFRSSPYDKSSGKFTGGWDTLLDNAALIQGGTGIFDAVTGTSGILGYDFAYNPTTGRMLIVGDSGPVDYQSFMAYADNFDGPWTYYQDPVVYQSSAAGGGINAAIYNPTSNLFIIANDEGKIWTSPTADSGSWTLRYTSPTSLFVNKITIANGIVIVACPLGTIIYSTDGGLTWLTANVGFGGTIACREVIWDGTRYIAVGQSGALAYATTLSGPWTQTTVGITNSDCWTIAYSPTLGRYVVGMGNATVRTATSVLVGATWTAATGTFGGSVGMIRWANGRFIAVGDGRSVGTSTNGTAFTVTQYNTSTTKADFWGVFYISGNTWVAVTEYTPALLWMSTDNGTTFQPLGIEKSVNTIHPGLPAVERNPVMTEDALELRTLSTTAGTTQRRATFLSLASTTANQTVLLGMFASNPLNGAQTVGGGTMILNAADGESNLNLNFWVNALNVYVWRPSTGTVVGYVRDATNVSLGGTEPTVASTTNAYVTNITNITSTAVAAQDGDVVVAEVWGRFTNGMATSYNGYFYYDGSTVTTAENTLVTNHASFIELTENLTFRGRTIAGALTETVTSSESSNKVLTSESSVTETGTSTESQLGGLSSRVYETEEPNGTALEGLSYWSEATGGSSFDIGTGYSRMVSTFKAPKSGQLGIVRLDPDFIFFTAGTDPTTVGSVQIWTLSSSSPLGGLGSFIASVPFPYTSPMLLNFDFSNVAGATVNADQWYAVVISALGTDWGQSGKRSLRVFYNATTPEYLQTSYPEGLTRTGYGVSNFAITYLVNGNAPLPLDVGYATNTLETQATALSNTAAYTELPFFTSVNSSIARGTTLTTVNEGIKFIADKTSSFDAVTILAEFVTLGGSTLATTAATIELVQLDTNSLSGTPTTVVASTQFFQSSLSTTIQPTAFRFNMTGSVTAGVAYALRARVGSDWGTSSYLFALDRLDSDQVGYDVISSYTRDLNDFNNKRFLFSLTKDYATSTEGYFEPETYPTLYWVGGTGVMDSTSPGNWAITSGGTPTQYVPSITTDAYIDTNSDTGAPFTIGVNAVNFKSLTVSGLDQQLTLNGLGTMTVGSLSLPTTNLVSNYSGNVNYYGDLTNTVNNNNNAFGNDSTFGNPAGSEYDTNLDKSFASGNTTFFNNCVYVNGFYLFSATSTYTVNSVVVYYTDFYKSTDLLTFTKVSRIPALVYSMAASSSTIVAVGDQVNIYSSTDGINWTKRTSTGFIGDIFSVTWTGTEFYAAGANGYTTRSSNGTTWNNAVAVGTGIWRNIKYLNNTYILVGNTGSLRTSPDGTTWTTRTTSTTNTLLDVSWSGSLYAVTMSNGQILTSPTLATWTIQTGTTFSAGYIQEIVYFNSRFIVVDIGGKIYTSADAINWTLAYTNPSTRSFSLNVANSQLLLPGEYFNIAQSSDAINFNLLINVDLNSSASLVNNRFFLMMSTGSTNGLVYTSTNNTSYTYVNVGTNNKINCITYGNSTYVGVGELGTIITSSDGINWTTQSSGVSVKLRSSVWAGSKFIVVGDSATVLTSPDGITWTSQSAGGISSAVNLTAIDWKSNLSLAAAVGTSGTIITSPDGVTWTSRTSGTTNTFNDIVAGTDGFFAVGNSSTMRFSTNGTTWSTRTYTSSYTMYSIAHSPVSNRYVIAGGSSNGFIATADNGLNFTNYFLTNTVGYGGVSGFKILSSGSDFYFTAEGGPLINIPYTMSDYTLTSNFNCLGKITLGKTSFRCNSSATNINASSLIINDYTASRTLSLGTNNQTWNLNGTGDVFLSSITTSNVGKVTFDAGTSTILLSDNTTASRTLTLNRTNLNSLVIGGNTSTSTTNIVGMNEITTNLTTRGLPTTINALSSTKTVAHTVAFRQNNTYRIGTWGIQGSPGNYVSLRKTGTFTTTSTQSPTLISSSVSTGAFDCVFANGKFYAVTTLSRVLTSVDGINWTINNMGGTSTPYRGIVFANNTLVAVGDGGFIRTSTDGITWTGQTSGTTNNLNDICWTGTHFFVVGNSGTILTSTDAVTWTPQTITAVTGNITRCASSGSYHMLGGAGGILYRGASITNIAGWTSDSIAGTNAVTEIAFGNGSYFVIGIANSSNLNIRYTTNNGTNWSSGNTGAGGPQVTRILWVADYNCWYASTSTTSLYVSAPVPSSWSSISVYSGFSPTTAMAYGKKQFIFIYNSNVFAVNSNYQLIEF